MAVGGRNRTFIIHKFPLRDPSGDVYGVCGIASDITERKEREDALRSKVEWSFRIRNAIERDRLVLYSQPIIEIAGGRVVQEELLLRMRGDDGELILPGEFLPPAERFDLAPAIDRWVIARADAAGPRTPGGGQPLRPEHRRRDGSWTTSRHSSSRQAPIRATRVRDHRDRRRGGSRPGPPAGRAAGRRSAAGSPSTTSAPATAASPTSSTCRSATSRSTSSSCAICGPTPPTAGRERDRGRGPQLRHRDDRRGSGVERDARAAGARSAWTTPRASTSAARTEVKLAALARRPARAWPRGTPRPRRSGSASSRRSPATRMRPRPAPPRRGAPARRGGGEQPRPGAAR